MNYTQHESDIEAIRRRWANVSSNDIDLTDAQRQIVTDLEVVLAALDEKEGAYEAAMSEVEQLEDKNDKLETRLTKANDKLDTKLVEANDKIADLEEEIQTLKSQIAQAEQNAMTAALST